MGRCNGAGAGSERRPGPVSAIGYCPQCGRERVSTMRFCIGCRLDFESVRVMPSGVVTPLARPVSSAPVESAAPAEPNQTVPVMAGIAWLIGAAAIGYLAFLQLEYSGFGFADADEARGLALWNGAAAAITAYFGAMSIVAPTRQRMAGGVIWAVINVAWGGYQVSQGLTHEVFILSLVAFSLAGILAFVAWSQFRQSPKAVS